MREQNFDFDDQSNAIAIQTRSQVHGSGTGSPIGDLVLSLWRFAPVQRCAVSGQKLYKKKFNIDFEYLPSPLDTSMFENIGSVEKIENQVAYVGRDSHEKGIDILKAAESKINGNVV